MKEQLFADWLQSKNVSTFDGLQELVLVEEFKSCVSRDMKLHLEELKLGSLHENAIAADEYALSHRMYKNTYGKWRSPGKQGNSKKENNSGNKGVSSRNYLPKKGKGSVSPKGSPKCIIASSERYKQLTCYFCKKKGHVRAQCYAYKEFLKYVEQGIKPVGLLVGHSETCRSGVPEGYKNYMSAGQVSSKADSLTKTVSVL